MIQDIYEIGLEKFAGDEGKAKDFTVGFLKEAFGKEASWETFGANFASGAGSNLAKGAVGAAIGLSLYGAAKTMQQANTDNLHVKFQGALSHVMEHNALLKNAPPEKVRSYADTVFKFAPHVAVDPNLLTAILSNAVHGEGVDPMTIRTLADLEARYLDSKKNALFTPKLFT